MNVTELDIPVLEGEAADAVAHRGGHIQIIAAAGSGKTEVVSQRVADLIATGVEPRSIVAFTFTEKAAAELTVAAAFVHDMGKARRTAVDIGQVAVVDAERQVQDATVGLRSLSFAASPSKDKCKHCDVRPQCRDAVA